MPLTSKPSLASMYFARSSRIVVAPVPLPDDPRGRDAAVKVMKAEARFIQLRESTLDSRDWRLIAANVRWAVRPLPDIVGNSISDGAGIQEVLDTSLGLTSGTTGW